MILVTGAGGYLGSHAMAALHDAGKHAIGVDNFSSSSPAVVDALERRIGERPRIVRLDLRDTGGLRELFALEPIEAVIHFAGFKSVPDSVADPLGYFRNNLGSTMSLLEVMRDAGVRRLIFSSSCAVYGDPDLLPVDETAQIRPVSPYGETKAAIERLLSGLAEAETDWSILALRYFNPIGADATGLIGEDPSTAPSTLVPNILAVAAGEQDRLRVFGDDHPTPDGSCLRDFLHVSDLVYGHIVAVDRLSSVHGFDAMNLGSGVGTSVFEMVAACRAATGSEIPIEVVDRRPGDASLAYARADRAREVLGWSSRRSVQEMIADHWRFHRAYPRGYRGLARL
jgi:UDP-glucose 4-epimerase